MADIFDYFFFFLYICNILWVTRKPPNIFTDAKRTAINPIELDKSKMPLLATAAIRPPTIITDDIAFVTARRGEWSAGVTPQTT